MNRYRYIRASGPSGFVCILREGSWFDSECTDEEYMVNFSGRYRELIEKPAPLIVMHPAGFT